MATGVRLGAIGRSRSQSGTAAPDPSGGVGGSRIEVSGLGMTYPSGAGDVIALEGIDLTVERREFISVVGPSGCGKSTLLRCIGGLARPSVGTVHIDDRVVTEPDERIGYVFQQAVLLPWLTVERNVLLPFQVRGRPTEADRARVREVLAMVGLEDYANHRPTELSGGMQQRVSVARALVTEPSILLMDEPFGALDAQTRESMNVELLRIWERAATTVVFVTHDIGEALFLSDRVIVMSSRPGGVRDVIDVDIDRPRRFENVESDERFWTLRTRIREELR